jgi:hypothetical protein
MNNYYVYFLTDPRNNEVFYIGKGKGNRINDHFRELKKYISYSIEEPNTEKVKFSNHSKLDTMKSIIDDGFEVTTLKVIENLSEEAAFIMEEILVRRLGQAIYNEGHLTNILEGGNVDYYDIDRKPIKTTMKVVRAKYPELIDTLKKYPNRNKSEFKKAKRFKEEEEFRKKATENPTPFRTGMTVIHPEHGLGLIKSIKFGIMIIKFHRNDSHSYIQLSNGLHLLKIVDQNDEFNLNEIDW